MLKILLYSTVNLMFVCIYSVSSTNSTNNEANQLHKNHQFDPDSENIDSWISRCVPDLSRRQIRSTPYILTEKKLTEIRQQFMYWYFDEDGTNGNSDLLTDVQEHSSQVVKYLYANFPFFGSRFNTTRVSLNGYIGFSDFPEDYRSYPLTFPVKEWPEKNDPSFIGICFSKCHVGKLREDDTDRRKPGVYFRIENDLQSRVDQFGVEVRERTKWDIREGIIGAETFDPKHVVIVTWKNVSFASELPTALTTSNTFQLVLATDEVATYAIYNYQNLQWTPSFGDSLTGEGGIFPFVGFNAGNSIENFEYKPYSQTVAICNLTNSGLTNNFPGRHIFRIDERIILGSCNKLSGTDLPIEFAPKSGNMLGGTLINITGPCFDTKDIIVCRFGNSPEVYGVIIDHNRASCIQPFLLAEGYVSLEIFIGLTYIGKGNYFVETPSSTTEQIHFENNAVNEQYPNEITVSWSKYNMTTDENATVEISLWGYRETEESPEFVYIDEIEWNVPNLGIHTIYTSSFQNRSNDNFLDIKVGFLQINLTASLTDTVKITPLLWSKPVPLSWYFAPQLENKFGKNWTEELCNQWILEDKNMNQFVDSLPECPCTLQQALVDKGRFVPDQDCDKDSNLACKYNIGAKHCVKSAFPSKEGAGQQCCYDIREYLMISHDQLWGSNPRRSHDLGLFPWDENQKVPELSHWLHDVSPKYLCCLWQSEISEGCEIFRTERRPTKHCTAYKSPTVAGTFGSHQIITFDDAKYTFNGKGEFVLVNSNDTFNRLDIQGRFQQINDSACENIRGKATKLTSVVARGNSSTVVEVGLRSNDANWRYRLNVFVNKKQVFFDRPSLKFQHFPGVIVYTPTYIRNQSEVVVIFDSGVGVEVIESDRIMALRVYLPQEFFNKTRGLFGIWNNDLTDEFTDPNGKITIYRNEFDNEKIHKEFGIPWMVQDVKDPQKGTSLFLRKFGRTSEFYNNASFLPNFEINPIATISTMCFFHIKQIVDYCEDNDCLYEYSITLNKNAVKWAQHFKNSLILIKDVTKRKIISCGVLKIPKYGRKSNFLFVPGTRVIFECMKDFKLVGDERRECLAEGKWNTPVYNITDCIKQEN